MANLVKAIYEADSKPCFVNMDYVVDIFPHGKDKWIAYTFDNERQGYIISNDDFKEIPHGE